MQDKKVKSNNMREIAERLILERAKERGVDVLDAEFVDQFIEATGAQWKPTAYGANKCGYLTRTLRRMYEEGKLNRLVFGISTMPCAGFPKWTYVYHINYDHMEELNPK